MTFHPNETLETIVICITVISQSDQSLCCLPEDALDPWPPTCNLVRNYVPLLNYEAFKGITGQTTFVTSCLHSCILLPFGKGVYSKKNKFFSFSSTPLFQMGEKIKCDRVASPKSISIPLILHEILLFVS